MAKIKPKQAKQTETPSGQFDAPIEVALTGSMLGGSVTDFETLIVRTISQVVYGDVASTAKSINDIKGFAKKNQNPFDVAENTLKKIESLEKIHKQTNEILKPIAAGVIKLAMFTGGLFGMAGSNTGFLVSPVKQPQMPGGEGKGNAQQVKIAIDSNNLDEVLKQLSNLSDDGTLSTLADVFEIIVDNAKGLKEVEQYMTPFTDSIIKLTEQNKNITEFISVIEPFIKGLDSMSKIKPIDTDSLELIGYTLEQLSCINFDEANVENVLNTTKKIINELSNIDTSSIDLKQFDTIQEIGIKCEYLQKLQEVDLSNIDSLILNVPKINNLVTEVGKVEKIKKSSLTNFNKFIEWINTLNFPKNIEVTRDFDKQLSVLADSILPKIQELVPLINELKIKKLSETKITNLNLLLEKLGSIKAGDIGKFKFDNKSINSISNLSEAMPKLVEIANGLQSFPKTDLDSVHTFTRILTRLSEVSFEGKNKIDHNALRHLMRSLPTAQQIIKSVGEHLDLEDNAKIVKSVGQLAAILKNLDEMKFNGDNIINNRALQKIADESITLIAKSINTINSEIKNPDNAYKLIMRLPDIVNSLDYIRFDGEYNVNINKLEEINKALPIIGSALQSVNDIQIKNAPSNLKYLISSLKFIAQIDTEPFKDKDLKPVVEVLTALTGITGTLDNFDKSSISKVDSLSLFIERLFIDKDSPLKKITAEKSITKEDIEKTKQSAILIKNLTDAAKAVAILGPMMPMIKLGLKVLMTFSDEIKNIIQNVSVLKEGDIEAAQDIMKGMCLLVAVSTVCMLIGGFFVVKMPELVIGALAFGLVLGLFLAVTIKAISWASKGLQTSLDTMKGVAVLIAVCTFTMLIGAAFVIGFPKLIIGALAFTIILGMFIFATLTAIRFGAKGLTDAMQTLREVAILIAASALVMMIGAAFVILQPKLILGAMMFTAVLGGFIFATLTAIRFGAKGIDTAEKRMREFAILIGTSAFVMMLGGALVIAFPQIIAGAMIFTAILGTFLFATLKAIKFGTKGIEKEIINIKMFAIVTGIAAGILLIGGGLFVGFPDLLWAAPAFAVTLAGFVFIMGKALKQLGNQSKDILKGAAAMAIIGVVVNLGATALLIIGHAMDHGILEVASGALIMSVTLGIVAAMSIAMGAAASNPFFWIGIGAMAAVSGIVMIGALAMLAVANAMKIFKEVGSFDIKPMLSNITGLISIATALAPIGLLSPVIVAASIAVASLSIAISKISEAVAEAASLKIPIYSGTKKVGYRQLKNKDFTDAAKNIKTIVTVLGKAIIDIYEKNPKMFDTGFFDNRQTPFSIVVKSTTGLAKLISKISESVKDYADLKIPIYSGTKVAGYKHLTDKDFQAAANNVKYVISVLGGALIQLYEEHPEMFKDTSIFSFMGEKPGNTPLSRTIAVTMKLGKLISMIASGVQDYADLKIPIKWNKDGKAVNFKSMSPKDVQSAADNVKYVIECLAGSLIKLYEENPKMFNDDSIFSFMGEKPGNTPLSRTISVTMKIGKLISSIASGVQDFAELKIPIAWNKDGKAVNFKSMSPKDIQGASDNVKYVIECLAKSLISLYTENEKMFTDDSIFSFMGENPGNTPLSRTISVNMKLGKLISSIADGVQKFGNLLIPIAWNKDGKAIKFQSMSDSDIQKAAENVKYIVSTLGNALMESYDEHTDWYKAPESLFGKIFGSGGGANKTPFYTVVSVNIRLAELISNIGKAVGNMAKLMIPTDWNKDGKAVAFRQLNDNDFKLAGENVGKVITTLGNAVMQQYEDHPDWFEDKDGDLTKDGKNKFSIVMKSTLSLSNIIKNIASGIKDYANLLIPDKWDKEGKAIHYRELTNTDFKNASDNIGVIITTVGEALMKVYKMNPKWFETDDGLFSSGDSDFNKVLTGCVAMGEMISSISEGIISLAQLQIPIAWDPKSGKPIKFREMKETDFTMAANSIDKVVSTVGQSLINLYENRPDLFDTDEDNPDSVFVKVAEGCSYLGDMIKGIAEGVVEMATLEETLKKAGINMTKNTYKEAAEKVSQVVCVVGDALMITFSNHKEWFQNPPIVTKKNGFLGIGGSTEIKPDNSDTPFQKMVKACALMGQMIIGIAEGVAFFATITQQPLPDGSKMDIPTATANIGLIITTVGKALMDVTKSASWYSIDKLEPIISAVQKSANAVHSVASLLEKIGKGNIPITDKEGNVIDTIPLNNDSIAAAAKTIGLVLSGVSSGLESAEKLMDKSDYSMFRESTKLNLMLDNINKAIEIVGKNVRTLAYLGSGKINLWNKDYSQIVETIEFTESDFEKAGKMIGTIMSTVAKGVNDAYKSISEDYPGFLFIEHGISNSKSEGIGQMLNAIERAVSIVGGNVKQLGQLAQGKINLWNNGKMVETISFNETSFKTAANMIVTILTTVASGVNTATKSVWGLFGSEKWEESDTYKMLKAVEGAKNTVGGMTLFLAHLANNEYVYFDSRYKKERRVPVSLTGIDTAAKMISYTIQEIAWGIGNGTSYVASLNMDNITKMLYSVEMAKDTVGRMALFLSHLANNEYVYFDTRYKRERKVTITEDGMIMAARIISGIITNIASGISEAVTSTSSSDVWGGFIWAGSKAYNMLQCVSKAIDNVGNVAYFISNLGNNEFVYHDIFDGFKEKRISITEDSAKNAANIIKTIITSIADTVSQATDKLNSDGFTLFGKSDDKIGLTFKALNKATSMLGRLAKVVSYYANGEIAETTIGADGTISIQRSGAPDVETAKKNMSSIITGLADIIKSTSEKIDEIDNVDETISGLHKSLRVVDASIYAVNEITKAKTNIDALQGFSFSNIMTPVLSDIDKVFAQMNSVGKNDKSGGFFGKLLGVENQSPLNQFINDANRMVMQSLLIASSPLEESYNKLRNVITSTTETMENFHLPENFGQQTESLDKFIKSVNTIKVDGVDSLTALLRELNKLGINMGNMDKLTTAISNKLSITLMNMKKSMDALNKTMIEDGKRKKKHSEEIRKSVTEIQKLMSQTMQVNVKMEDSGSSSIGESENDTNSNGGSKKDNSSPGR